jgi:hypothetical protein
MAKSKIGQGRDAVKQILKDNPNFKRAEAKVTKLLKIRTHKTVFTDEKISDPDILGAIPCSVSCKQRQPQRGCTEVQQSAY